jgi:hypothetical protein
MLDNSGLGLEALTFSTVRSRSERKSPTSFAKDWKWKDELQALYVSKARDAVISIASIRIISINSTEIDYDQ